MSYEDRISIATPEGVDLELILAGVGSRFVAGLLDQLIKWAVMFAAFLGLMLAVSNGAFGESSSGDGGSLAIAALVIVVFLAQFAYDVLFETLASGRTPGKRWTGLRVVTVTGAPIGFVSSAVRNLLRLVDGLPGVYAVGIVAILVSSRNQRLGDMAAGALVVRERRAGTAGPVLHAPATRWGETPPAWDVSAVTPEEVATVRRFLERRTTLTPDARVRLAGELALRLRPKVVGPPDGMDPEAFLEDLSAAKASRS